MRLVRLGAVNMENTEPRSLQQSSRLLGLQFVSTHVPPLAPGVDPLAVPEQARVLATGRSGFLVMHSGSLPDSFRPRWWIGGRSARVPSTRGRPICGM